MVKPVWDLLTPFGSQNFASSKQNFSSRKSKNLSHAPIISAGLYLFKIPRDRKFREKPESGWERKFQHQNGELRGTNITRFYGKIIEFFINHLRTDYNTLNYHKGWSQAGDILVENLRFLFASILNYLSHQNN